MKIIAGICASPAIVLAHHGIIGNKKATCYPAENFISTITEYQSDSPVVVDTSESKTKGVIMVTSQGPGTTALFACKLIELLVGKEKAMEVAKGMLIEYNL